MTRSIRLQLGPNTTATHCGDCPHLNLTSLAGQGDLDQCTPFDTLLSYHDDNIRAVECIQAEAALSVPTTYTARPRGKR